MVGRWHGWVEHFLRKLPAALDQGSSRIKGGCFFFFLFRLALFMALATIGSGSVQGDWNDNGLIDLSLGFFDFF